MARNATEDSAISSDGLFPGFIFAFHSLARTAPSRGTYVARAERARTVRCHRVYNLARLINLITILNMAA